MKNKVIENNVLIRAISNVVDQEITLKDDITLYDLIELKEAISPINNLITSKLTDAFINKLNELFHNIVDVKAVKRLLDENQNINVNANGFDFFDSNLNLVAEIKANRPYYGNKYGAAQKSGIDKDIKWLLNNKTKSKISVSNCYKFLAMLSYEKGNYSSKSAIDNYIKNCKFKSSIILVGENTIINRTDVVYIVLINLDR